MVATNIHYTNIKSNLIYNSGWPEDGSMMPKLVATIKKTNVLIMKHILYI